MKMPSSNVLRNPALWAVMAVATIHVWSATIKGADFFSASTFMANLFAGVSLVLIGRQMWVLVRDSALRLRIDRYMANLFNMVTSNK